MRNIKITRKNRVDFTLYKSECHLRLFFRERLFLFLQNQEYLGVILSETLTRGFRLEIK